MMMIIIIIIIITIITIEQLSDFIREVNTLQQICKIMT